MQSENTEPFAIGESHDHKSEIKSANGTLAPKTQDTTNGRKLKTQADHQKAKTRPMVAIKRNSILQKSKDMFSTVQPSITVL